MKRILLLCILCIFTVFALTSCNDTPDFEPAPEDSMAFMGDGSVQIIVGEDGTIINGQIHGGSAGTENGSENDDTDQSGNTGDSGDSGACTEHSFSDWYVLQSPTCSETGQRQRSCVNCAEKENEELDAVEHSGGNASCDTQAICVDCDQPYGDLTDHIWEDASCIVAKHCTVCSATEGSALDHTGGTASCDQKAICTRCGDEYGNLKDHKLVDATCTSAKYCSVCNETFGSELGHSYTGGECIRCGKSEIGNVTVSHFYMTFPISTVKGSGRITDVQYSVSGSTLYITLIGQKTSSAGTFTFGWHVYVNGYQPLKEGTATTDTLSPGQFSYTFAVENVISSSYKSYQVFIGAPLD
ncbi:MAG: hypothetical protein IJX76_10795 [Clostridia bacterium]|nr:hypothetical protein [Clostridia bacterium]